MQSKLFYKFSFSLVLFICSYATAQAEECTHLWNYTPEINEENPKPMSGDSFAAYGLIGWHTEPNLKFIIKGDFAYGRFMSFESYETKDKEHTDAIFDYELQPDAGSVNPFLSTEQMDAPNRSYTVEAVVGGDASKLNVLRLNPTTDVQSIFYRWYVPFDGFKPGDSDRPRLFAVDARTGEPRGCPQTIDTQFHTGLARVILRFIPHRKNLKFKDAGIIQNGTNFAIPSYTYALTRLRHGDVAVVKFKSPTFMDTQSGVGSLNFDTDVRYWSLCTQNLKVSETLACMPDYMSKVDAQGYATIVISKDPRVKTAAESRGYAFLEDRRDSDQKVMAILYRNLLPREGFPKYEKAYCARGVTCTPQEFLSGQCLRTSALNDCDE